MKRNYDECVTKYSDSFVRVVLDPGYVSRIQNFVTELVEAKSKEDHHKIDSNKEVKRFTTGFLGEAALEKLFGMEIMPDHVHILMEVAPQFGIHKAVKSLKGYTSKVLRSEYPSLKTRMPSLWTNSYFVSTVGGAPLDVIKQYIENQKTSQRQKDKLG